VDNQLFLPLRVHGRSYGAIVLQQRDGAELLTPDETVLLERLAVWLAGSIASIRAEQYERLLGTSKGGA
jgi:GAF domain-containing protein